VSASDDGVESAFGGRSSDADRQTRRSDSNGQTRRSAPGDRRILRSPGGLLIEVLKGTPEGDDAEVLGAAIDRLVAWDRGQESSGWVTSIRPGIGLRAWSQGGRWSQSLRSSWGGDR
jgi:hypothetical protein